MKGQSATKGSRLLNIVASICALMSLCAMLCMGVFCDADRAIAAEIEDLDMNARGSITVSIADTQGARVAGGALVFYKIADLTLNGHLISYAYTEEFAGCPIDISSITADLTGVDLDALAEDFCSYVERANTKGQLVAIDADGTALLDDADLGLYLVTQTQAPEGHDPLCPFLVTVPLEEDDLWLYDVDAAPKTLPVLASDLPVFEEDGVIGHEIAVPAAEAAIPQSPDDDIGAKGTAPGATTGKASGLAQTGDALFNWIKANLPWIIAWIAMGAGGITAYCVRRLKRRLSTHVQHNEPMRQRP